MPVDAPTTCWTTLEEKLRTLLSQSLTFQAWLGVANATLALDKIFLESRPVDDASTKLAIVSSSTSRGFGYYRRAAPWDYAPFGILILQFIWISNAPEDNYAQSNRQLKNAAGQIVRDILTTNANTEGIGINNVTCVGPIHRSEQGTTGPTDDVIRLDVMLEYREP